MQGEVLQQRKSHMKKLFLIILGAVSIAANAQAPTKEVSSNITSNTTFYSDTIYILRGIVKVINNATLTIQPGTIVKGGTNPQDNSAKTALFIQMGSKLNAIGTKTRPIVFTSNKAAGDRDFGDWGGIVIYGNAPTNQPSAQYEGGIVDSTVFGGNNVGHDAGTLKYVRIEFAGYPFVDDKELNSLTLCGVGNGTTISYVQTSYNNDDAFEWFGGTVNCDHLFAFRTNDDDFDVDWGFSGKVQFGVSVADKDVADKSTKNGFEVDNDANSSNLSPRTSAVFSNMTVIGAYETKSFNDATTFHGRGAHLRRNSAISVFNSIWMGWKEGIRMDAQATLDQFLANDTAFLENNIIAGCKTDLVVAGGADSTQFSNYYRNASRNNRFLSENTDVMITAPYGYATANFLPQNGSPALTGASFGNSKLTGFETVTYVGAFGTDNWLADWTELDPVNADYSEPIGASVKNVETILNTNVYPNPAKENITIEFDLLDNSLVTVNVTDITGKVVKVIANTNVFAGSQLFTANVSDLNTGIYFINIRTTQGMTTIKTVVNR